MNNQKSKNSNLPSISSDLRLDDTILSEQKIENLQNKRNEIEGYLENIDNEILIHYFYDFFENKHPEYKEYIQRLTFSIEEISIDFDERRIINFECDYTENKFNSDINIEEQIENFFFPHTGKNEMDFLDKVSFIEFKDINDENYISKLYNNLNSDYLKEKEFYKITENTHTQENQKKYKKPKL